MTEACYLGGLDLVWIAGDREGHVGAFVTAGDGPIPIQVLGSEAIAVEDIEEQLYKLPRVSSAQFRSDSAERRYKQAPSLVAMAERGLFVYDWSDVHRTRQEAIHAYELIAVPRNPTELEALPAEMLAALAGTRLDVAFGESDKLDVRKYVQCREPEWLCGESI